MALGRLVRQTDARSAHLRDVSWRRPRGAACRKTSGRGAKRTQICGMGCSTPKLALESGCPACRFNGRLPYTWVEGYRKLAGTIAVINDDDEPNGREW